MRSSPGGRATGIPGAEGLLDGLTGRGLNPVTGGTLFQ